MAPEDVVVVPRTEWDALCAENARLGAEIEQLRALIEALRARGGKHSGNSSIPPSKDSIAAKAQQRAGRRQSQRVRSQDHKPGGQVGHPGSGLEPTADPNRSERVEPPTECSGCGGSLAGATKLDDGWAQVWDIPPIELERVHYLLARLQCVDCGKITTASPPFGPAWCVSYGPNVNSAAILLGNEGNVPMERTATLMESLLAAPVSTAFVALAQKRFADGLQSGGLDEAMGSALRAEAVLCGDETPVNLLDDSLDENGAATTGAAHVVTLRTPDERLVWLRPTPARSSVALKNLGVLDGWQGVLVRDDYAGWYQFDEGLAGVQQCVAHLIRHLQGVYDIDAQAQGWARNVQQVLRDANAAVVAAVAGGERQLDAELLASLLNRYDSNVAEGITINRNQPWPKGNHPGYNLAKRLHDKADQVWLFTTRFDVPWTNNASERALKGPKRHQAVSGYWHTHTTLARYCRVHTYLVTTRNHGIGAISAIHAALMGRPWLPTPITT